MLDIEIIPHGRDKEAAEAYKILRWIARYTRKQRDEAVVNLATKLLLVGHVSDEDIEQEVRRVMDAPNQR